MPLLFPDTTVLINFVLMARVDLFAELVGGNGTWTYTIAEEAQRRSVDVGLDGLLRFRAILGEPLMPSPAERIHTNLLRARIASPGDNPLQHFGEAEALAIMSSRAVKSAFVTDDLRAADVARSPDLRIAVCTTGDLIRLAVKVKLVDLDTAWDMIEILRSHNRARGMPTSREHLSQWVFGQL